MGTLTRRVMLVSGEMPEEEFEDKIDVIQVPSRRPLVHIIRVPIPVGAVITSVNWNPEYGIRSTNDFLKRMVVTRNYHTTPTSATPQPNDNKKVRLECIGTGVRGRGRICVTVNYDASEGETPWPSALPLRKAFRVLTTNGTDKTYVLPPINNKARIGVEYYFRVKDKRDAITVYANGDDKIYLRDSRTPNNGRVVRSVTSNDGTSTESSTIVIACCGESKWVVEAPGIGWTMNSDRIESPPPPLLVPSAADDHLEVIEKEDANDAAAASRQSIALPEEQPGTSGYNYS